MMKPFTLFAGTLALIVCTSFQDEKVVKKLPEPTHTGQNIFACTVDGDYMIAKQNSSEVIGDFGIKFSYSRSNRLMYIQGSCNSPQYDVELCFRYDDSTGTYPLVMEYPYYTYFWNYSNSSAPNASNQYQPDAAHKGSVTVTYYDGNIIAGTFAFEAVNRKGEVVHVEDGRFDLTKQQ